MGHEFMEMKNTNAAIQSYRHAIGKSNDNHYWIITYLVEMTSDDSLLK